MKHMSNRNEMPASIRRRILRPHFVRAYGSCELPRCLLPVERRRSGFLALVSLAYGSSKSFQSPNLGRQGRRRKGETSLGLIYFLHFSWKRHTFSLVMLVLVAFNIVGPILIIQPHLALNLSQRISISGHLSL